MDMGEIQDISSIYPLHSIVKNDILQMSLHDFLLVDNGEKGKVEQFQSKRNGMAIGIVLL